MRKSKGRRGEELLTLPQAAVELGLPRSTAWLRAVTNRLPATRVGRTYVVRRADLERYRAQQKPGVLPRAS